MKELTVEELIQQPNFAKAMGLTIYIACGETYPEIAMNLINDTCVSYIGGIPIADIAVSAGETIIDKI